MTDAEAMEAGLRYGVVIERGANDLAERVGKELERGGRLIGGIAIARSEGCPAYAQAMWIVPRDD